MKERAQSGSDAAADEANDAKHPRETTAYKRNDVFMRV
jgi:hypothetical protein